MINLRVQDMGHSKIRSSYDQKTQRWRYFTLTIVGIFSFKDPL